MFSKGTFQRYVFEIESSHRRVHDLYAEIAAETNDPKVHEEIEGFLAELEGEQKTTDELRAALQG